jgi:alpha-galactosidase
MKRNMLWIVISFLFLNASAQDLTQLAKTPPLGWNSWDCFGMDVNDAQVRATADYMAKYLKSHGWEYVVVDMGWYYAEGLNTNNFRMRKPPQYIDEYGRLIPNTQKFPSANSGKGLKPVADYVHNLGLKFGLHIMRGIPWQAVEQNTPIKGTGYRAKDIASYADSCRWYHGMIGIDMTKPGAQDYYNSILDLYKDWGVDYIKADDMLNPYRDKEIGGVSKAIKNSGRPIVLSLSAGPVGTGNTEHLRQNAHLWRISGDMWDHWSYIKNTFEWCRRWQDYVMPNHWPDCDMLPIGKLRINGTDGALANRFKIKQEDTVNEFDRLTKDEKYTLMTLWIIFRSPLMMGGNLMENDELILKLLTNDEALAVNQKSSDNHELRATDTEIIWFADGAEKGVKYVAFFNIGDEQSIKIKVTWDELGITGRQMVRDIWNGVNIGSHNEGFEIQLVPHASGLFKITRSN